MHIKRINEMLGDSKKVPFKTIKNVVTDIDGNSYDGIEINGKVWMASNLRTKHLNDGTEIGLYEDRNNVKHPCYAYPQGVSGGSKDLKNYGLLYNFESVKTEKLAPKGWHIPTKHEYSVLLGYLSKDSRFNLNMDYVDISEAMVAKALSSQHDWKLSKVNGAIGCEPLKNNTTGFCVYPAGYFSHFNSNYRGFNAGLWSSDTFSLDNNYAESVVFYYDYPEVTIQPNTKAFGLSVRCVRD